MKQESNNQNKTEIQVIGRTYLVEIPVTVYASYFDFLNEPDVTTEDKADFLEGLAHYVRGNFDFISPNKSVRSELRQIRQTLKIKREKYLFEYKKKIESASTGGKKTAEKIQSSNYQEDNQARALAPAQAITKANTKTKANLNNPPKAPLSGPSGVVGGGSGSSFSLFERYRATVEMFKASGLEGAFPESRDYSEELCRYLSTQNGNGQRVVLGYMETIKSILQEGKEVQSRLPDIMTAMRKEKILQKPADKKAWAVIAKWEKLKGSISEEQQKEIESKVNEYPTAGKWEIFERSLSFAFNGANDPVAWIRSKFN